MANSLLTVENLSVQAGGKEILKGLDLEVGLGEVHVVMGPNGAGKSTLAHALLGHPKYEITGGKITFQGQLLNDVKTHRRAQKGLFLSFQYPLEISGLTLENFLRSAKMAKEQKPIQLAAFKKLVREKMQLLEMEPAYAQRYLNEGFSGGEKKKSEILQMLVLEPTLAILDETDSGLDIDAVRIVAAGVRQFHNKENSLLIITHHRSLLEHLQPDYVHFLIGGKIVKSGRKGLLQEIEKTGFAIYQNGEVV